MPIDHSDQPPANPERSKPEPFMTALVGHRQRRKPKPTPPPAKNRGFKGLVIVLLVLILAVLIWPRFSEGSEERDCTSDGGRILVHTLTGRRLCDFLPLADGIFDMSGRDYWID